MRAETFLSMFRVLEGILGRKYSDSDRRSGSVVMQYIQDPESEPVRQQLDVCREVRNLLTHNADPDGSPIVEPSQALLDQLYEIISYAQKPRGATAYATPVQQLLKAHRNDRALNIMRCMEKHGYSHVPVVDDGVLEGVFSKNTVFSRMLDGGAIDGDTRIGELSRYTRITGRPGSRYAFIDERASYLDARAMFEKDSGRNNRLAAIFITHTGESDGLLIGMLTPWDVMNDSPD